ncbi:unnamed protein product [Brugia pahangi]|uniref:PE-PGRS family protein n=1 Tax=Brugia pahangi TaxID=6280 RepID=A0A0N4TZR4_BRUPA|nr:unnamed protein product [Brugia pahangi]
MKGRKCDGTNKLAFIIKMKEWLICSGGVGNAGSGGVGNAGCGGVGNAGSGGVGNAGCGGVGNAGCGGLLMQIMAVLVV